MNRSETITRWTTWGGAIFLGLSIASTWIALDLPRVVLSSELQRVERETKDLIRKNTRRADSIEDLLVKTQQLVLINQLAEVQREIEDLGLRLETDPHNRDLISLRRTLREKESGIKRQIDDLSGGLP